MALYWKKWKYEKLLSNVKFIDETNFYPKEKKLIIENLEWRKAIKKENFYAFQRISIAKFVSEKLFSSLTPFSCWINGFVCERKADYFPPQKKRKFFIFFPLLFIAMTFQIFNSITSMSWRKKRVSSSSWIFPPPRLELGKNKFI